MSGERDVFRRKAEITADYLESLGKCRLVPEHADSWAPDGHTWLNVTHNAEPAFRARPAAASAA